MSWPVPCGLCASVRVGRERPTPASPHETARRLAEAQQRVADADLARHARLPPVRVPAPERLGDPDDIRGGVVAQAYNVLGRPGNGRVPRRVAQSAEAGAALVARSIAGLYVPPWVGGGGRIVYNSPVIAALLGREAPEDRDAVATLVVGHERTHHLQHALVRWQDEFLTGVDAVLTATDRSARRQATDRAQAMMAVVEGHASWTEFNLVDELHGPNTWWRIRGQHLTARPPGLLAGLLSVLFASKRDQYQRGMVFTADAAELVDDAPRRLFSGAMPTPVELDRPGLWAARLD